MEFNPIGVFHGAAFRKYDAPRQGVFEGGEGTIELNPRQNFEQALRDLDGFERIWVLFIFDRNGESWRPTTRPPVAAPGRDRVGLFASRSPYRPNPIGLSCVRLLSVSGRTLSVAEADLLDGTPILDVKPYIPAADAFPDARAGWVDSQQAETWRVEVSSTFAEQADFICSAGGPDLAATARLQLSHNPFDDTRKRVEQPSEGEGILSLRMFRIVFSAKPEPRIVQLLQIQSGYTADELANDTDPYGDKSLHRSFIDKYLR